MKRFCVLTIGFVAALAVSSFFLSRPREANAGEEEESSSSAEEYVFPYPVEEGYTRYEAEEAEVNHVKIKGRMTGQASVMYGHYSGEGFVGEIDYEDSRVDFAVNVEEKGNYKIKFGYAIGTDFGAASFSIFINGSYYSSLSCTERKGWGSFDLTKPGVSSLNLEAGANTVTFMRGYNYVELDYLDIGPRNGDWVTPSSSQSEIAVVPEGYTRYEAEEAKVSSGKIYTSGGTFSGKGYVGELDWVGVSKVEFKITVPEEGEYSLHLAYAIGIGFDPASFKLFNDAGFYCVINCDVANGWGVFDLGAIAEASISLRQGLNHVTIYKSLEYAQIDFIDISDAKIGEYRETSIEVSTPNLEEGYTRYEAEDQIIVLGEPKGIGFFLDFGEYSGYGYVGSLDSDDRYVEFPIDVEEAGEYQIKVCYAAFEAGASFKLYSGRYGRGGGVYYYGETTTTVANGWGMFSEETIITTSISLQKGHSFLIFRSGLIRAEIDYIDLGSKIGEYQQGTLEESLNRAFA